MNKSKQKGTANEQLLTRKLQAAGIEDAKRVILSGALADLKGDISSEVYSLLAECKVRAGEETFTNEKSFRVEVAWLDKLSQQAAKMQKKHHVLLIRLSKSQKAYAVLTLEQYAELLLEVEKNQH